MPHQKAAQSDLYFKQRQNEGVVFQRSGMPDLELILRELDAMPSMVVIEVRGCPGMVRVELNSQDNRVKVDRVRIKLNRVDYSGAVYRAYVSYRYPRLYFAKRHTFALQRY